jgi:hypothetical protein
MAFHNLCSTAQTQPGTEFLLGLGLKYCIESHRPFQRSLDKLIGQIQRSVRLHFAFKNQDKELEMEDDNAEVETQVKYIPSLYLPSGWQRLPAPDDAEKVMSKFDERLNVLIRALSCSQCYNLSRPQ